MTDRPGGACVTAEELSRFRSRIEVDPAGCHRWTGRYHVSGYGMFDYRRRSYYAHRVAWLIAHGSLPPAPLELDHLCRNLEPVTGKENKRRSPINISTIHANQTHCVNGHPFDKENTYLRPDDGSRMGKTCGNERRRLGPDRRKHPKTHCPQGHEFTEANTRIRPDGRRTCRACANDGQRARRKRREEAA